MLGESFSLEFPRTSREQFETGRAVSHHRLAPGDLVFFDTRKTGTVNHVGIYMGEGMFAHASRTRGVVYESMRFFPGDYRGARSIFTASARRTALSARQRVH